ncbi:hypothetical protein PAPYR_2704 [Paratrimastix pyriformis]|uniref:Uncharacterized protein n=1 Tax=Paratrimastix pyriformis TaxID=342808 RepID=A0ABQ8UNW9_9EUKA|nr:hypothetical protein PAPYR_2704 [Paratrimastix pyriformis]
MSTVPQPATKGAVFTRPLWAAHQLLRRDQFVPHGAMSYAAAENQMLSPSTPARANQQGMNMKTKKKKYERIFQETLGIGQLYSEQKIHGEQSRLTLLSSLSPHLDPPPSRAPAAPAHSPTRTKPREFFSEFPYDPDYSAMVSDSVGVTIRPTSPNAARPTSPPRARSPARPRTTAGGRRSSPTGWPSHTSSAPTDTPATSWPGPSSYGPAVTLPAPPPGQPPGSPGLTVRPLTAPTPCLDSLVMAVPPTPTTATSLSSLEAPTLAAPSAHTVEAGLPLPQQPQTPSGWSAANLAQPPCTPSVAPSGSQTTASSSMVDAAPANSYAAHRRALMAAARRPPGPGPPPRHAPAPPLSTLPPGAHRPVRRCHGATVLKGLACGGGRDDGGAMARGAGEPGRPPSRPRSAATSRAASPSILSRPSTAQAPTPTWASRASLLSSEAATTRAPSAGLADGSVRLSVTPAASRRGRRAKGNGSGRPDPGAAGDISEEAIQAALTAILGPAPPPPAPSPSPPPRPPVPDLPPSPHARPRPQSHAEAANRFVVGLRSSGGPRSRSQPRPSARAASPGRPAASPGGPAARPAGREPLKSARTRAQEEARPRVRAQYERDRAAMGALLEKACTYQQDRDHIERQRLRARLRANQGRPTQPPAGAEEAPGPDASSPSTTGLVQGALLTGDFLGQVSRRLPAQPAAEALATAYRLLLHTYPHPEGPRSPLPSSSSRAASPAPSASRPARPASTSAAARRLRGDSPSATPPAAPFHIPHPHRPAGTARRGGPTGAGGGPGSPPEHIGGYSFVAPQTPSYPRSCAPPPPPPSEPPAATGPLATPAPALWGGLGGAGAASRPTAFPFPQRVPQPAAPSPALHLPSAPGGGSPPGSGRGAIHSASALRLRLSPPVPHLVAPGAAPPFVSAPQPAGPLTAGPLAASVYVPPPLTRPAPGSQAGDDGPPATPEGDEEPAPPPAGPAPQPVPPSPSSSSGDTATAARPPPAPATAPLPRRRTSTPPRAALAGRGMGAPAVAHPSPSSLAARALQVPFVGLDRKPTPTAAAAAAPPARPGSPSRRGPASPGRGADRSEAAPGCGPAEGTDPVRLALALCSPVPGRALAARSPSPATGRSGAGRAGGPMAAYVQAGASPAAAIEVLRATTAQWEGSLFGQLAPGAPPAPSGPDHSRAVLPPYVPPRTPGSLPPPAPRTPIAAVPAGAPGSSVGRLAAAAEREMVLLSPPRPSAAPPPRPAPLPPGPVQLAALPSPALAARRAGPPAQGLPPSPQASRAAPAAQQQQQSTSGQPRFEFDE